MLSFFVHRFAVDYRALPLNKREDLLGFECLLYINGILVHVYRRRKCYIYYYFITNFLNVSYRQLLCARRT